jgi:signal transduction histidine kinase
MKFNNSIKSHKWLLVLLLVVVVQIITVILTYSSLKEGENNDIDEFVNEKGISVLNELNVVIATIIHIINRNGRILSFTGKKTKPDDFKLYVDADTLPHFVDIGYQRWYPRITHDERPDFEAFGNEFIQDNFSIIDFTQIRPFLITEPADNRSEYIIFAVSEPPFLIGGQPGPMGGDVLNISSNVFDVELAISYNIPTPARRTFLFALNSEINYTLRVLLPVYEQNSTDFDRDNLLGITELIFTPNNVLNEIINNVGIGRDNVDVFIYDLHETINNNESLIYREDKGKYNKYGGRDNIPELMHEAHSYNNQFIVGNRSYYIQFNFDDSYLDEERSFLPEGILIMLCILFLALNITSIIIYKSYINNLASKSKDIQYAILSNVNHNMRNPLNGIKGLVEVIVTSLSLLINPNDEELDISKKKLENIEDTPIEISSHELRDNYVNPLIDAYYLSIHLANTIYSADYVTDVIIGNNKVINNETTLENIVGHINNIIASDINENQQLSYHVNMFNPKLQIVTDIDRISQIIVIFLRNSFQYTNTGSIRLSVTKNENNVIFNVIDTGIGVSNDIVSTLFKMKNIKPHVIGSGGLGTYHAKLIADSLGGEVGYTKLDTGSLFWLSVPISSGESKGVDETSIVLELE